MSGDFLGATVESETTDPMLKTPTSVAFQSHNRLLIANAEYFNTDGPPNLVVSIRRP
jgi:hypothetical protein